jgi:hypothetical protein
MSTTYTIHRIHTGDLGTWTAGDQLATADTAEQAEQMAGLLAPKESLGVVIRRPDGTLDFGAGL